MRVYTVEFKRQALELAASLGNASKAAEQLGISPSCIYQWQSRSEKIMGTEGGKTLAQSPEQEELQRLRREVSELKKVNHILKSAAAFFSQDHLK